MASALSPNIAANYAANPTRGFDRLVYEAQRLPNLWEQTYLQFCTNNIWGGSERLRRSGNSLVFTRDPVVQALDKVEGQPLIVQRWRPETVQYTPKRSDYLAVADTPESKYFSPYNEKEVMLSQGDMAMLSKTQREFIEYAIKVANRNPENVGSTNASTGVELGYAGARTGSYLVGSPLRPVYAATTENMLNAANAATCPKALAVELLENAMAVIDEQSMATMVKASPSWATMPRTFAKLVKLSLSREAKTSQDTKSSWFFADADVLIRGDNQLAGYDHLFMDNMLPCFTVPAGAGTGNAPAGTRAFPVVFGRQMAIVWDQVFTETASNVRSQQNFDSVDMKMRMYDFYAPFDKLVSVLWFTTKPYNVNT